MEPNNKTQHKIVQTYAEDMANIIESESGLVKKIINEEEKHEVEKLNLSPDSKSNKVFMFVGIFFIALSLMTLLYFFFSQRKDITPIEQQFTPIVFNDHTSIVEILDLRKSEIAQAVFDKITATKVEVNGVEGVYLTEDKQTMGLRRFIALIEGGFSPNDNPLFVADNFMLGVVKNPSITDIKDGTGFFMLIKMRTLTDIFDSMRVWEGKMLLDLHGFIGVNITNDDKYLLNQNFEDGIVENKNARTLYTRDNKLVLMYIFADDNSVIVTDSKNAAHEIMLRLAGSQKKQ